MRGGGHGRRGRRAIISGWNATGTKIFPTEKKKERTSPSAATSFLGHALSDLGGGESFPFQVFPPRENTLRDALLNIRLTSRRLLGILIDKFYPGGRASYSKLRVKLPSRRTNLAPRRLLNAPIRVPDAIDCLISSRLYWLASISALSRESL